MTDVTPDAPATPAKRSKLPMILGLVLALAGAGGGFGSVYLGFLPFGGEAARSSESNAVKAEKDTHFKIGDIAFVPIPQIIVSLNGATNATHLRFVGQLEVPSQYESEVTKIIPRVVDVLNDYLRAVKVEDIEAQGALFELRTQMLRRVQVVAGDARVNDLLVMEFILN